MKFDPVLKRSFDLLDRLPPNDHAAVETVAHTFEEYSKIETVFDWLQTSNSVSKEDWQYFESFINQTVYNDISQELREIIDSVVHIMDQLFQNLKQHSGIFLIDGFTLTKAGKKELRKAGESIRPLFYKLRSILLKQGEL